MLDVRSSDVSASHGARIERLDEKKLFYMKSRGIDSTQAKELIIS
jgi:Fe-S cluster assembly scaffold protein SufB